MRTLQKMIDQEIRANATNLIDFALKKSEGFFFEEDCDDVQNLYYENEEGGEEMAEPLQYYIVTNWLYQHLSKNREFVFEFANQYFWGRATCGQLIEADHVIKKIYEKTHK